METLLSQINDNYNKLNQALLDDIQPYLGCTDITIVALGTALATQASYGFVPNWVEKSKSNFPFGEINTDEVESITLEMNEELYKNAHATAIPNSGGYSGISRAAALGVLCNPEMKLNLLEPINSTEIQKMKEIFSRAEIKVKTVFKPACNLYLHITVTVKTNQGLVVGESLLQDSYTNVIFLKRNDISLLTKTNQILQNNNDFFDLEISTFLGALDQLSPVVYHRLEETIILNTRAYEYGLVHSPGLGVGTKFTKMIEKGFIGNDSANQAAAKTAAAEDVRMGGENIPVMGVASSGSHGITSSIPIIAVAEKNPKERKLLLKSIALSFWITQKIKKKTGFLSTPCGCVISSGIGATAGITYYMGGNIKQIEQAVNNFIISTAGVICDGGKTTCSIKLANAASTAVTSAFLALEGIKLSNETGGLVREDLQQNISNLVKVSQSMKNVDRVSVEILKQY